MDYSNLPVNPLTTAHQSRMHLTAGGRSAAIVAVSATCQRTAMGEIKGAVCGLENGRDLVR